MNIFSCNRARLRFLYLNELIYNILRFAQKTHKNVRIVQDCTKNGFCTHNEFLYKTCTNFVRSGRGCISEGCEGLGSDGGTFAQKTTIDFKRVTPLYKIRKIIHSSNIS